MKLHRERIFSVPSEKSFKMNGIRKIPHSWRAFLSTLRAIIYKFTYERRVVSVFMLDLLLVV